MKPVWTPIYFYKGNLFVVISVGFVGRSEEDALFIGEFTASSVEKFGGSFTGVALEVAGQHPHVMTRIAGLPVAVLSGPVFRKGMEAQLEVKQ